MFMKIYIRKRHQETKRSTYFPLQTQSIDFTSLTFMPRAIATLFFFRVQTDFHMNKNSSDGYIFFIILLKCLGIQ